MGKLRNIYIGDKQINTAIHIGTQEVKQIYCGTNLVYDNTGFTGTLIYNVSITSNLAQFFTEKIHIYVGSGDEAVDLTNKEMTKGGTVSMGWVKEQLVHNDLCTDESISIQHKTSLITKYPIDNVQNVKQELTKNVINAVITSEIITPRSVANLSGTSSLSTDIVIRPTADDWFVELTSLITYEGISNKDKEEIIQKRARWVNTLSYSCTIVEWGAYTLMTIPRDSSVDYDIFYTSQQLSGKVIKIISSVTNNTPAMPLFLYIKFNGVTLCTFERNNWTVAGNTIYATIPNINYTEQSGKADKNVFEISARY